MQSKSPVGIDAETNVPRDTQSEAFQHLTVLGICGSIGSGKSFAARLLTSKLNQQLEGEGIANDDIAHHIDTDSLAHGVYAPGNPALDEIKELFGSGVVGEDGTIDRKALGKIVFSDTNQMKVSDNAS